MKRLDTLDTTKGLLLVLMTITHIGLVMNPMMNAINHQWFYLFKMPGFYIISGYLMFNSIKRDGFISKKVDGIYKPYLAVCCVLFLAFFLFGYPLKIDDVLRVFLGYDFKIGNTTVFPAWFILNLLPSFLVCRVLIVGRSLILKVAMIAGLICLAVKPAWSQLLPFNIGPCIFAVVYLMTGYFLRYQGIDPWAKKYILPSGLLYFICVQVLGSHVISLDIAAGVFKTPPVTWFVSVCGVFFVMGCMSFLRAQSLLAKLLRLLSQNSLYVLILHYPVFQALVAIVGLPKGSNVAALAFLNGVTLGICVMVGIGVKSADHRGFAFKPSMG